MRGDENPAALPPGTSAAAGVGGRAASSSLVSLATSSTGGRDLLARARTVSISITRARGLKRRYTATVTVTSPQIRFVSYDHLFRDTNVRRLLAVLAGSEGAVVQPVPSQATPGAAAGAPRAKAGPGAHGAKASGPHSASGGASSPASCAAPSEPGPIKRLSDELSAILVVTQLELLRGKLEIVLNLSPVPTGGVLVLPPLTALAETVALAPAALKEAQQPTSTTAAGGAAAAAAQLRRRPSAQTPGLPSHTELARTAATAAPLSISMLLKINAIVFRALASSSVDAVSSSLVAATAVAAAVLGRSLEIVDSVNGPLLRVGIPGAELMHGATGAGRALVEGAVGGTGAILSGSVEATKLLAAALSSGSVSEMARGIERGARVFSDGIEGSVEKLASGLHTGLSAALGGVDLLADRFGPAGLVVRGVTDSARHVTGGVGSATVSIVGSVLDGSAQLVSDVARSGARAGMGLVTLDVDEVLAGSGQLLGGVVRTAGTLGSGVRSSVGSVAGGAIKGIGSATSGVRDAGEEVFAGVADTHRRAARFWTRPLAFLARPFRGKGGKEAGAEAAQRTASERATTAGKPGGRTPPSVPPPPASAASRKK
jgi:hypothetical protein